MTTARNGPATVALLQAVGRGESLAIARAITAIENRTSIGIELGLVVQGLRGQCRTMGVTGPPGAGKSSLINALMSELLPRYRRIGVLTVDPSSPVSGGAVLGDRVRMAAYSANPNVFIRSLATRGHLGGVTRTTRAVIDLFAAGGMDLVIVETVGTGQSEVEVAELTDVKIVVCAPGLGDEMQAIKAGVLEIADLIVINKSDLPDADRTAAHLQAMLHHRGHDERRLAFKVSTLNRNGLATLAEAIEARFGDPVEPMPRVATDEENPQLRLADDVASLAAALIRESLDPRIDKIVGALSRGAISRGDGAIAAIRVLADLDNQPEAANLSAAATTRRKRQ